MSSKIFSNNDEPIAEINIVPFVDIILVVLIIFMVTTPLIIKPSIKVQLPKAASGEESTPSQFNISISAGGEFMLNGKSASTDEINDFSKSMASKNPEAQAIISADKDVSHGTVVSIIDAVKTGGIQKFAITIDKK